MFTLMHARPDGSFVVNLDGAPYHVTANEPMFAEVSAAAAGAVLPPEPLPAPYPPQPRAIAKTTIYRRATDDEVATFLGFLKNGATPRQRLMWEDAESGLVLIDDVMPLAVAMFGEQRAAELLA